MTQKDKSRWSISLDTPDFTKDPIRLVGVIQHADGSLVQVSRSPISGRLHFRCDSDDRLGGPTK